MNYIVFWKDAPGQQVSTIVDAENHPIQRDSEYIMQQNITVLTNGFDVLEALSRADGRHYATTPEIARATLGWDV
jgi:hypothetical protein